MDYNMDEQTDVCLEIKIFSFLVAETQFFVRWSIGPIVNQSIRLKLSTQRKKNDEMIMQILLCGCVWRLDASAH